MGTDYHTLVYPRLIIVSCSIEQEIIDEVSSPQLQSHLQSMAIQSTFIGVLAVPLLIGHIFALTDNHIYYI